MMKVPARAIPISRFREDEVQSPDDFFSIQAVGAGHASSLYAPQSGGTTS